MGKIKETLEGKKTYIAGICFIVYGAAECGLAYAYPVAGTSAISGMQNILTGIAIISGRSALNKLNGKDAVVAQVIDSGIEAVGQTEEVVEVIKKATGKENKTSKEDVKQASLKNVSKSTAKTAPVAPKKSKTKLGDLDFKLND